MTIKASVNGNKVVTGECILSYPSLFEMSAYNDDPDKMSYNAQFIYEVGSDTEKALREAHDNAVETFKSTHGGKAPKEEYPLIREDEDADDGDVLFGKLFTKAKSFFPVSVIDQGKRKIEADDERIYAGAIVRAVLEIRAWEFGKGKNPKSGVSAYLKAVQLVRDGERLGGGSGVELFDELFDGADDFLA